jgi:hypothetical protein
MESVDEIQKKIKDKSHKTKVKAKGARQGAQGKIIKWPDYILILVSLYFCLLS